MRIVYGGVYPSYAFESILNETPAIDVIARGEAEQTILELPDCWEHRGDLTHFCAVPSGRHPYWLGGDP